MLTDVEYRMIGVIAAKGGSILRCKTSLRVSGMVTTPVSTYAWRFLITDIVSVAECSHGRVDCMEEMCQVDGGKVGAIFGVRCLKSFKYSTLEGVGIGVGKVYLFEESGVFDWGNGMKS